MQTVAMRRIPKLPLLLLSLILSTSSGWASIPNKPSRSPATTSTRGRIKRFEGWFLAGPTKKGSAKSPMTVLRERTDASTALDKNVNKAPPVDFGAIGKYGLGLALQLSFIFGFFTGVDTLLTRYASVDISKIPLWVNFILFYVFNLRTSLFSPLPSQSDTKLEEWQYQKRNRPSWTPPGWVFALMWPLFVFGTRAFTAAFMVKTLGKYANSTIMALMLHLSFANLWNTMCVKRRACLH